MERADGLLRGEMLLEWSLDASCRSQSASENPPRWTSLAIGACQTTRQQLHLFYRRISKLCVLHIARQAIGIS
jgi:hypothetical protein